MVFSTFLSGWVAATVPSTLVDGLLSPLGGFVVVIIIAYYLHQQNRKLSDKNEKLINDLIDEYKEEIKRLKDEYTK